jgi:D-alanine-D-alanine ligase
MKINKRIEIVSSTEHSLSSMSKVSRTSAKAALAKYFTSVNITIINSVSDLQALVARKPDLIFLGMSFLPVNPALGWEDPEKIWLSDYLELHEIAYTGSNQSAGLLERNKHLAKQRMLASGLVTSPFFVVAQSEVLRPSDVNLAYPLFVKPTNRGGGLGIDSNSLVQTFEQLQSKTRSIAAELHSESLVEQYLPGREFSVAILRKEHSSELLAMPLELIAPLDQNGARILSGKIKSLDTESFVEVNDSVISSKVTSLALDAFQALGARDYGRIDVRLDAEGEAYFLEANLLPSLMDGYGNFPKACLLNIGLEYEHMIVRIAKLGLARSTDDIEDVFESIVINGSATPVAVPQN